MSRISPLLLIYLLSLTLVPVCAPVPALAAEQAYTTTYSHAVGDDETRTQARRRCLAEAKRRILEQAGTYVSSSSTVKDFSLTDDQITEITAGVMEVEVLDEKTALQGEALVITMSIKAMLDPDEVRARIDEALAKAHADQSDQEARISELERQLEELKQKQEAAEAATDTASDTASGDTGTDATGVDTEEDTSSLAESLGRLLPEIAVRVLTSLPSQRRTDVLRKMDPDARSRLSDQVERQAQVVEEKTAPETVRTLPDPRKDPGYDARPQPRRQETTRQQRIDRQRVDRRLDQRRDDSRDQDVFRPWTPRRP